MIIVELNNINVLNSTADGFLIGIKGFSSECYKHYTLEETIEIIAKIKKLNKLAFIDLTNIFHDQDLENVKELIHTLNNVDGYFYFDLGVMNLIEKSKRVYYAPTYLTNQFDIDIVKNDNNYVLVSPELSLKELNNIKYDDKSMLLVFGPWEIFHSRRPLISNYFKYRNKKYDDNAKYHIIEEFRSDNYPIIENNGTKIYLNGYYSLGNGLKDKTTNLLIKTFDLESDTVLKIVDLHQQYLKHDIEDLDQELNKLGIDLNKGLLFEESILRKGGNNE